MIDMKYNVSLDVKFIIINFRFIYYKIIQNENKNYIYYEEFV